MTKSLNSINKMLIIGATSVIAQETAKRFAADGAALFLVGRNTDKLAAIAADLRVRGAKPVETLVLDITEIARHQELLDTAISRLGGLDAILIAHGTLSNQRQCEQSVTETLNELNINFTSVAALLTLVANVFENQKHGCIGVIGSVAGDRGRASIYVYGTAKAALATFMQGLRGRLSKSGVNVLTIKPGRVDTPMTSQIKKSPLLANPAGVGNDIHSAMLKGKDVIYTPGFWRYIMLILTSIPESVFKKLPM